MGTIGVRSRRSRASEYHSGHCVKERLKEQRQSRESGYGDTIVIQVLWTRVRHTVETASG